MASLRGAYAVMTATMTGNAARTRADPAVRAGDALPMQRPAAAADVRPAAAPAGAPAANWPAQPHGRDLRGTLPAGVLRFAAADRLLVSGLPGSGKSTLMRRTVALGDTVRRVDSQDARERWERRMPHWVPYAAYRLLVRMAHFAGLWGALTSGASVVVHDCGTQSWVRRWVAWDTRRRGRRLHLLLLDVPPELALEGQAERGRGVSGYAFVRHRHAVARLVRAAERGRRPGGCHSVVLLDRAAANSLTGIAFEGAAQC